MDKDAKFVYNADGVPFTIYKTVKLTKSGPRIYWLLADGSSGKRRLLNHRSRKAAEHRADQIRTAMVKGRADRQSLSPGQWQQVCLALEIVRSRGESPYTAVRTWALCSAMLGDKGTLEEAVGFFKANHRGDGPQPKLASFDEGAARFHEFKVADGKSVQHCKNIHSRLCKQLPKHLPTGVRMDELTGGQLDQAVAKLGLKAKTKNEYRIVLSSFYKWAGKQNPPFVSK